MSEIKIKDLGLLDGPVWIFGGIYSNLEAFDAFLALAAQRGIKANHLIFTGDSVAYCADAAACVARILALGCPSIQGNTDAQLAIGAEDCGCGFDDQSSCALYARDWYAHALGDVARDQAEKLGDWPDWLVFEHHEKRIAVVHGAPSDVSKFIWPTTSEAELTSEIAFLTDRIGPIDMILSGHSGIAFDRQIGPVRWVNAGVIGMPAHDGDPRTCFAILDEELRLERLSYDPSITIDKMRKAGLVQGYERCLASGYWPSEDTLPEQMRGASRPKGDG